MRAISSIWLNTIKKDYLFWLLTKYYGKFFFFDDWIIPNALMITTISRIHIENINTIPVSPTIANNIVFFRSTSDESTCGNEYSIKPFCKFFINSGLGETGLRLDCRIVSISNKSFRFFFRLYPAKLNIFSPWFSLQRKRQFLSYQDQDLLLPQLINR